MEELDHDKMEELALTDVSNSLAVRALEQLLQNGAVTEEKAAFARRKYEELHSALVVAMKNDKTLLAEAKELNRRLQEEKQELERVQGEALGASHALELTRDDSEQAESEATLCREKEQMLLLEANELTKMRNEFQRHLEEIEKEHAAALEPQIRQLRMEIQELKERYVDGTSRLEQSGKELEDLTERLESVRKASVGLKERTAAEAEALANLDGVPEKLRKQGDVVYNAIRGLKSQEERFNNKIREQDIEMEKLQQRTRELAEEHGRGAAHLDRLRLMEEQKERGADDIRKDLELSGIDADQYLADQVQVTLTVNAACAELRREQEELNNRVKDKDSMIRRLKRMEVQVKQAQSQLPPMVLVKDSIAHQLSQTEAEKRRHMAAVEELKRDVDIHMAAYLREETLGKGNAAALQASYRTLERMEKHVAQLAAEERATLGQIADLGSQRERISRACSQKVQAWRETLERMQMKELVILDLKKKQRDVAHRLKDFNHLYDLVKNQRNKFVTLIQAASQSIAEMKEKLKLLAAELEILHAEVGHKSRLLAKARSDHSAGVAQRDHLRSELSREHTRFREKQRIVEDQITTMDKLSAIISAAEREMLRMKKQYETYVESRNFLGITLIDRNDELCILYEKSNIQEEVAKQSEIELKRRQDEVRMLTLEVQSLERSMVALRKMIPEVPATTEQIEGLKRELAAMRAEGERLSALLEDPGNPMRSRQLDGAIPSPRELAHKLERLEEQLSDRKEQMHEKDLILDEVTSLSNKLRSQAAAGRDEALSLAKQVNEVQSRVHAVTRSIMATVSELSMTQALAMRLKDERDGLEGTLEEAKQRVDEGEAPTADAEREWLRMERHRVMEEEMAFRRAVQRDEEQRLMDMHVARRPLFSMAEQRPNAYIPENLGIPKPYGGYSPFKPMEPGSTMRHIRKPEVKPIEI